MGFRCRNEQSTDIFFKSSPIKNWRQKYVIKHTKYSLGVYVKRVRLGIYWGMRKSGEIKSNEFIAIQQFQISSFFTTRAKHFGSWNRTHSKSKTIHLKIFIWDLIEFKYTTSACNLSIVDNPQTHG